MINFNNHLAVLQHLFPMYGHITPQQLKTREVEICNMHFHISIPVDAIFNSIDELMELAEYAFTPWPLLKQLVLFMWNFSKASSCCRISWLGIVEQLSITHGRTWKCISEMRKGTCCLFQWHRRSTPSKSHSFSGLCNNMPSSYDPQHPNPTDASFFQQVPLSCQQHSWIW